MKECPICGNDKITRDIRNVVFEYKGQKITIEQPGFYCDECGEAFYDSKDIKATKKELADFRKLAGKPPLFKGEMRGDC